LIEKILTQDKWKGQVSTPDDIILRKIGAIFESAKKTTVRWESNTKQENYIYRDRKDKRNFHISLANPPHPLIPTMVGGNHELAHMGFDSFTGKSCKEFFSKWVDKFPPSYKYKPMAKEMFEMLSNIIEDERIESLLGDIYAGTGKEFQKYGEKIGQSYKKLDAKDENPCNALIKEAPLHVAPLTIITSSGSMFISIIYHTYIEHVYQ